MLVATLLTVAMVIIGAERLAKGQPNPSGLGAILLVLSLFPALTQLDSILPALPFAGIIVGGIIGSIRNDRYLESM